nr:GAF domain-containing sensor histidine kinase [Ktedonobacteraceae bacterium]
MKTITTTKLTRAYLQKLDRQNYLATTFAVLLATISLFWMLFHIGGDAVVTLFADLMYGIAALIGAIFAFTTAYRAWRGPVQLAPRHQLAWLLISLGMLADSIGGFYFAYLEHMGQPNPIPSGADIGFTLFYPCIFFGLLSMPTAVRFRTRTALDALITTLCLLGVSWFFAIGPAYIMLKGSHISLATFTVSLSYPFWDMLLIFAIVLLIRQRVEKILRPFLLICGLGVLSLSWADTTYAYFTANGTYTSGTPAIDTFWFVGSLLIGLSALYQYKAIVNRAYNEMEHPARMLTPTDFPTPGQQVSSRRFLFLQSSLIYFPLLFLITLVLYREITNDDEVATFLVFLTALVGILLTVRYLLATYENHLLLKEREQSRQDAEHLRLLGKELTSILEFDALREQITFMAAAKLTFDAAMLVLIDEQHQPTDKHASLLVCLATSHPAETQTFQLSEVRLPPHVLLLDGEREVVWADSSIVVPPKIAQWLQAQNIRSTLFIPLIYQKRVLGSLGFASRTEQHFSQHDIALARTYAEQITTVIEHSRLYQAAIEQELFAKAMANIATRLNSAVVVEPAEIYQLICVEAASALRADYALLYCADEIGQLVPLATYINEQEPVMALHDWPPISRHEHDWQMLTSLQPILVQFPPINAQITNSKTTAPLTSLRMRASGVYPAYSPASHKEMSHSTSLLREKLLRKGTQTAIFSPLITNGDAFGLLILARTFPVGAYDKMAFDNNDLSRVQDFAEQAAVALTNAQLYEQQRQAHQRLQELDHLKDQFMVTASHELRTPLTGVQGYIELLAQYDEMLPAEQRKEFLQKAQRSCDELVVLLGNVMDASRLEIEAGIRPANMENVNVRDMIDSVINLIEPHLTKEHRQVHLALPPHLAVRADAARLRQVLVNISVNALKYSPPETPIAFTARALRIEGRHIVIISISDKGKGITPQDQNRLFGRFVRLESDINSEVRGSGLGLYISRRLIEAMDGKIWIESRGIPGEGSTFHMQLPMA